jgi:hypothetical protein
MGDVCSKYGGQERSTQGFEGKNHWEDPDLIWRIRLKYVFKKLDG